MTDLETLYEREAELVKIIVERERSRPGAVDINGRLDLYEVQQEIKQAKRVVRV